MCNQHLGCLIARAIVKIDEPLEFPAMPGNLVQVSMRSMVVSRGREFIVPLGMCSTSNGTTVAFESFGIPCRRRAIPSTTVTASYCDYSELFHYVTIAVRR